MDLIISGDRTRTTRAKTDIQRMAKDYNLSKISDLVGKVIRMTDKTGRQVYTRITKVTPFTQEYQDATWQKEGWEKAVTDNLVGKYPYALEFEVIQPSTQPTVQPSQIEYTPENITSLKSNEVFVFGSNTEGKHGDGAAKTAVDKFGAKYGEPKGLQGQSYAIITKDLSKGKRSVSLDSIYNQVIDLNDRAKVRDDLKFYVTKFGTDLAGFTTEEIKQIWQDIHENYIIADNIVLPKEFEVRDKQPAVQGVSSNVEVVSPDYGVVVVETNPSLAKTEEFVKIIQPQIEAQAYKENTSGAANDMFMYQFRWTRKKNALAPLNNRSYANNGLPITDAKSKDSYVYDTVDQNGNPLPPVSDLQQIIDEIQNSLGIDMSDYDAVIGNIYLPGQNVATHRDTTESLSARNYPVIVYTIGNDSGIGIYEDKENPGSPSFRSDSRKEIPTKNGTIYTFGMDGKGRFELAHDTPKDVKRDKKFPPITLPNGTVIENYTITLTFRRAADLTPGMPTSPRKITRGVTKTPLQTPSVTDAKTPNVEQAKKIIDQQLAKIEEVLSNPENNVIMDNSLLISQKTKEIAGDYAGSKAIADYLYGEIYKRFGLPISGTGKFSVRELIRENQQGIEGVEADKINKEDLNGLDLDGTCFRA